MKNNFLCNFTLNILIICICSFDSKVFSSDNKIFDNREYDIELFRRKHSSRFYYSNSDPNTPHMSIRRGQLIDWFVNNTKKSRVTFMSSLTESDEVNQRRKKSPKLAVTDEVVGEESFNDELEMSARRRKSKKESPIKQRTKEVKEVKEDNFDASSFTMKNCGVSKGLGQRIVNGRNAEDGMYPWIVAVLKSGEPWCGAAILNENWIITAAHCFMGEQRPQLYAARVGTNNRNIGPTYKIKKIIMHERFHLDNMFNSDIALMKTEKPIKMADLVNGICLPSVRQEEPKSASLIVAGWGALSHSNSDLPVKLQEVNLKRISDGQCARKYKMKQNTVYRSQLCTWSFNKDACQGDSGGPAIELYNSRAYLVGIVSYGSTCADEYPGVYTQVSYFLDWIQTNIEVNNKE